MVDLEGEEYPAQITYTWEAEINSKPIVTAEIEATKVNLLYLHDLTEMWTLVLEDIEYKIKFLKKQGKGNKLRATIKAIPLFFDDFDAWRIYDRYDRHMTAHFYFSLLFDDTKYNFVLNGTFEAQQWEGAGEGKTHLKMFEEGLNRYKGEFRIVGNTVFIENFIGIDSQARYEHRLNASNIVQEIDANEFYTFARGYGDYGDGEGGEDWQDANLIREYTSPLARIPGIGIRHAPPIKNGNITTTETMDSQLKILVDESLKISVTATIHDLREQGYPIAQSGLGDRVFLIDRRIGFDEEIRVASKMIKKRWDGKVIDASYTFGTPGLVKRHQANLNAAAQNISDLLNGDIKLQYSVLPNAVQEVTDIIKGNTDSVFRYMQNGVIGWNGDNPNYMTRYVGDGIGFSRDGGATFEIAMTAQAGIVADVIRSGSMLADRIAGGILTSLNRNTVFNLNDGLLTMENANFELGNGALIKFTDTFNKVAYTYSGNTSGLGVGTTTSGDYAQAYIGVSRGGELSGFEDNGFSGFFANALDRFNDDGIGNTIVTRRLQVRSPYFDSNGNLTDLFGFVFNMNRSEKNFYAIDDDEYDLGRSTNRFSNVYARTYHGNMSGSLSNTSAINSKTAIEGVNAQHASEFFKMTDIKSYFYKDDDITDKFKRKVGPIIEQLDPVLENLYKFSDSELDVVSNFWLYVAANQYDKKEILERLERLENGTETA